MSPNDSFSPELFEKALNRVLADLAREDNRSTQLHGKDRSYERKSIVLKMEVVPIINGMPLLANPVPVWVRNLSRSGISFVTTSPLRCQEIGIHLLNGDAGAVWMHGQVVRERPIQDDFWEFGVRFIGTLKLDS